jgi:uncharacterized 2Fe-2S/4Fe-4S cluster protein (DUF4445 family)
MTEKQPKKKPQSAGVRILPFDVRVEVAAGTTILDAVAKAGLPLQASCGGKGSCGDCVVQVLEGKYTTRPSAALSPDLAAKGYVLACLAVITGDLTVDLPHFEEIYVKSADPIAITEADRDRLSAAYEIDPTITGLRFDVPRPSLESNRGDLAYVLDEIRKSVAPPNLRCAIPALQDLAAAVRADEGRMAAVLFRDGETLTIIDIRPARAAGGIYGVACDIGTTTVALSLVDLEIGEAVETVLGLNRQLKCGEDIISRINYAARPGGLEELRRLVVETINRLVEKAVAPRDISTRDIYMVSVSGNTTMLHLLLNLDPRYIREEPYVPTFNILPFIRASDIDLRINPAGRVHIAPAVGSYVGGDITAGLLATPMLRDSEHVSIFIDVGTNGEMVVGNRDWLMTCACSAGPACEGGGVRCGMPATRGAIDRVRLRDDGRPEYRVIENTKPMGVCGSGLVDIMAELLIRGFIDRRGKFRQASAGGRLVETDRGTGFLIEKGENTFWGHDLVITERDIANLIRTKGAVFSACSLLLKQVGLTFDRVDAFYIAGGFGHHLDVENAVRIGLLPDLERRKFHYLGNTSLLGAYLILISESNRKMVEEVAARMTYVELNTEPSYMNEYTGALFLPHTDLSLFPSVRPLIGP